MKVALFGSGKMGSLLREYVSAEQCVPLDEADVCIDFSHKDAVVKNVTHAMMQKVPIVVGTTGWEKEFDCVAKIVKEAKGALLYGANFSEGMYLFSRLIRHANILLKDFDVAGSEIHHKKKVDAPSGTAIMLQQLVKQRRKVPLEFQSVRVGTSLGIHSVFFDSPHETIECTHRAKNRDGYAKGALAAASWLIGKTGLFTFEDFMEEKLACAFREPSLRS